MDSLCENVWVVVGFFYLVELEPYQDKNDVCTLSSILLWEVVYNTHNIQLKSSGRKKRDEMAEIYNGQRRLLGGGIWVGFERL